VVRLRSFCIILFAIVVDASAAAAALPTPTATATHAAEFYLLNIMFVMIS